ncbi:MAG: cation:proton antiporter [Candidatus Anstonellaceae archaeon]
MSSLLEEFFFSFGLVSIFSFLGGLLSNRWKQPTIVGLLVIGMLIGPNFFGFVSDNETIKILAEFGIYLLLFSIGLEFSIGNLIGSFVKILFSYFLSFLFLFIVGYEIGLFLLNDPFLSIFFAFAFTFSSTAVFANHLKSCSKIKGLDFSIPVFILIVQDIVAITLLTILYSIKNKIFGEFANFDASQNLFLLLLPIFFSLVILAVVYSVFNRLLEKFIKYFYSHIEEDNIILLILGITAIFSILAGIIGLSPAIGAFLAGSLIASLPIKKTAQKVIFPFSYAFASYFFLSLGLLISPSFVIYNFGEILIASLLFSLTAFLAISFSTYLSGYTSKNALFAGAMFATISEFSLVIGKELKVFSSFDFVSFFSSILFLSAIFSSFLIKYVPPIFLFGSRIFSRVGFTSYLLNLKNYVLDILSEFEGKGPYFLQARKIFFTIISYLQNYAVLLSLIFLVFKFFGNITFQIGTFAISLSYFLLFLTFVLFLPILLPLLQQTILFFDAIISVFSRKTVYEERIIKRIFRNFLLLLFFLFTFLLLPIIFTFLRLPAQLNYLNLISLFGILITLWDTFRAAVFSFSKRRR